VEQVHRRYFERNRGDWDWVVRLRIRSFKACFASSLPRLDKLRIVGSWAAQAVVGELRLWTRVVYEPGGDEVGHLTEFRKLGACLFRSEERMTLLADGRSLRVEGVQFVWPRMSEGLPLGPFEGEVLPSSTEARYGFEVLGAPCEFVSQLDGVEGIMRFKGEWLEGSFELSSACKARLRRRRDEETSEGARARES